MIMDDAPTAPQAGPTARPNKQAQANPDAQNQGPDGKEDRLNDRAKRERMSEEIDKRIQAPAVKIDGT